MDVERFEVPRPIAASPAAVFAVLTDPNGHVAIDSSGMLQWAEGERVTAVGDEFVVHMDRESFNDYPMGKYDVTVTITGYEQDRYISWEVSGQNFPSIGHYYGYRLEPVEDATLVTSIYDWSAVAEKWKPEGTWPIISEPTLKASLLLSTTLPASGPAGRVLSSLLFTRS